jgi:hypothetical protein
MPEDGDDLIAVTPGVARKTGGDGIPEDSLLSPAMRERLQVNLAAAEGAGEAFETENGAGWRRIWWIDPQTNRKVEFQAAGTHHDVSRSMGMIFAVDGNQVWGAAIKLK